MKKIFLIILSVVFTANFSSAQSPAMDFNRNDCNGTNHHLFADLDAGKVAVMEFFMTCPSCIAAGTWLETQHAAWAASNPGMFNWYSIAYTNSYTCSTVLGFVGANNFTTIPMDSGSALVNYYGGFGMPTIVIVAGANHDIIYQHQGFSPADTSNIKAALQSAKFDATGISPVKKDDKQIKISPNPSKNKMMIEVAENYSSVSYFKIFDVNGKEVKQFSKTSNKMEIDISDLADGEYFLEPVALLFVLPSQKFLVAHSKN